MNSVRGVTGCFVKTLTSNAGRWKIVRQPLFFLPSKGSWQSLFSHILACMSVAWSDRMPRVWKHPDLILVRGFSPQFRVLRLLVNVARLGGPIPRGDRAHTLYLGSEIDVFDTGELSAFRSRIQVSRYSFLVETRSSLHIVQSLKSE